MSDTQFLTQVPYQTQVSTNGFGADGDTSSQAHLNAPSSGEDAYIPPSAQHVKLTPTPNSQNEVNNQDGLVTKEFPNSSNDSIECQPFMLPATNSRQTQTQLPTQADSQVHLDSQPFPLVDWIKKIREDTPRTWPTFPLRWARTISKEQRAILDQDDAWSPPLAGKPVRPGTVPIRLLTILTENADNAALVAKLQDESARQNMASASPKLRVDPSASIPRPANIGPIQHHEEQSDNESESATQLASQWSSSPPRPPQRLAPPDTSPIRESTFNHPSGIHFGTEREISQGGGSCLPEEQLRPPTGIRDEQPAANDHRFGSSPPEGSQQAEGVNYDAQNSTNLISQQSTIQEDAEFSAKKTLKDSSRDVSKKATPKVQVRDTPFPKPILKSRQPPVVDNDLPQSSFVGATYPNHTPKSTRTKDTNVRVTSPRDVDRLEALRPASSSMMSESRGHHDQPDLDARKSLPGSPKLPVPVVPEQYSDDIEQEQRPSKRIRLSPAKETKEMSVDLDYAEIDQKRIIERRTFRKSIPAVSRPHLTRRDSPVRNVLQQGSVSRTSSPQHTDKRSHGVVSESGRTTATNLSMHRSAAFQPTIHRHAPLNTAFNPRVLASLLKRYRTAYPTYQGNEKAFTSALRLIISLRSQPREPHPSLWDDFIFRKLDDYKAHLQYCIDEGENALSYQDYYHIHVKRPERSEDVINEEAIVALHTMAESIQDTEGELIDSREKSVTISRSESLQNQLTRSIAAPQSEPLEVQPSDGNTEVQSNKPASLVVEDEPIEVTAPKERKRTRRSLPWTARQSTQAQMSSPKNVLSEAVASAPRSSASEKVEEWLNSSGHTLEESDKLPEVPLPQIVLQDRTSSQKGKEKASPLTGQAKPAGDASHLPTIMPTKPRKNAGVTSESDMARFVRLYSSLQSERHATSSNRGQQPINVYTW